MRANSLSVCIPDRGCDKDCPYCVSKMTGKMTGSLELMKKNINKVLTLASHAQVTNVIFTGKGEPMLNRAALDTLAYNFKRFPTELQTNGQILMQNVGMVEILNEYHINTIAISVDSWSQYTSLMESPLFNHIESFNMSARLTFCVSVGFHPDMRVIIKECLERSIHQFSYRKLTIPEGKENTEQGKWIMENTKHCSAFFRELSESLREHGRVLRRLPWGATLYDVDGIGVTHFDHCIQEQAGEDDIRSLIFQEDGHVYTSWNSLGSRVL